MPSESKNRTNYTEHNPSETKETTKKKSDQNTRQFSWFASLKSLLNISHGNQEFAVTPLLCGEF